ncbi:MAG: hypothetical protein M3P26_06915 [Gemmatimonadota bacterium]|nr:hypothetical protein [Gemmatimonadota bacterium]
MRSLVARVAAVTSVLVVCSAHVGSPDAWYEGNAGPYHVIVQIATPGVVPGVANVFTRVVGRGVEQVTVQANRFDALAAAPPPEVAEPVEGDPGLYAAPLWIMSGGSNSVTVNVRGSLGTGKALVPVVVVANRRLELDPKLGVVLVAVGAFLFVGLITIIGASVRESVLPPGEAPDARRKWKARAAMAATASIVALALFGGSRWWNLEDSRFNRSIYKPLTASAAIVSGAGGKTLDLRISDSAWTTRHDSVWLRTHSSNRWSPLIPDHGKLIHVFMIREPDLLAFAHLHPSSTDSVKFPSILPALPAGRYRIYGDIVHESGFTQTLSTKVDLPEPTQPGAKTTDADDASHVAATAPNSASATLEDGSVMTLEHGPSFVEGKDASLRFTVVGTNGKPLTLEPYIGMAGHAVVSRDDGAVFVHLHPSGTISMASQMAFMMRQPGDTVAGRLGQRIKASEALHPVISPPQNGAISFPYAFPKPGKYHMWVQVKHGGRILTGAYAFEVQPAKA